MICNGCMEIQQDPINILNLFLSVRNSNCHDRYTLAESKSKKRR